jgi:hypothetical protein
MAAGSTVPEADVVVITVDGTGLGDPTALIEWFDRGLIDLVAELTSASGPSRSIAVDLRVGRDTTFDGVIRTVRGLVQAYVRESGPPIAPVNVVVSTVDQERDRASTWRYLAARDGGGARGATFDLRERIS